MWRAGRDGAHRAARSWRCWRRWCRGPCGSPRGPSRHCGVLVAPHLEQHLIPWMVPLAKGNSSSPTVCRRLAAAAAECASSRSAASAPIGSSEGELDSSPAARCAGMESAMPCGCCCACIDGPAGGRGKGCGRRCVVLFAQVHASPYCMTPPPHHCRCLKLLGEGFSLKRGEH